MRPIELHKNGTRLSCSFAALQRHVYVDIVERGETWVDDVADLVQLWRQGNWVVTVNTDA